MENEKDILQLYEYAMSVSGRVQGLKGIILAFLQMYPDRDALRKQMEFAENAAIANAAAAPVSEQFLSGVEEVFGDVRKLLSPHPG